MPPVKSTHAPTTGSRSVRGSLAKVKLRVNKAFETMKKANSASSTSSSTSILPTLSPSLSPSTVPVPDFTSNLPGASSSTSTAAASLWQSLANNNSKISILSTSTAHLSTDSTTSSSDDFFSLECPVFMSLSYSGSMQGLEVVHRDTTLSTSNSSAYNEVVEVPVVAMKDNHAKRGCLVAMKDLSDDITLAAREVSNFCNSPRKTVTFNLSDNEICYMSVEDVDVE